MFQIYSGITLYMFRAVPLPETYRVLCRSKFEKLVHLVGFIIKKFVTMHGHMNGQKAPPFFSICAVYPSISSSLLVTLIIFDVEYEILV
jgi:hypothetical protein